MPGNILHAECACGFSQLLMPGADISGLQVMAYTADMSDIETVDLAIAERAGRKIIEDPVLAFNAANIGASSYDRTFGPYLCPQCREVGLVIRRDGSWD